MADVMWNDGSNVSGNALVRSGLANAVCKIYGRWSADSGIVAAGAESLDITVTHNWGINTSNPIFIANLRDGSWSHEFGWRIFSITANDFKIKFRNNGPNSGEAFLDGGIITFS